MCAICGPYVCLQWPLCLSSMNLTRASYGPSVRLRLALCARSISFMCTFKRHMPALYEAYACFLWDLWVPSVGLMCAVCGPHVSLLCAPCALSGSIARAAWGPKCAFYWPHVCLLWAPCVSSIGLMHVFCSFCVCALCGPYVCFLCDVGAPSVCFVRAFCWPDACFLCTACVLSMHFMCPL